MGTWGIDKLSYIPTRPRECFRGGPPRSSQQRALLRRLKSMAIKDVASTWPPPRARSPSGATPDALVPKMVGGRTAPGRSRSRTQMAASTPNGAGVAPNGKVAWSPGGPPRRPARGSGGVPEVAESEHADGEHADGIAREAVSRYASRWRSSPVLGVQARFAGAEGFFFCA